MQFTYIIGGTPTDLYLETSSCRFCNVQWGKITVDVYIANEEGKSNAIVWETEGVLFYIAAFLDQDELIELIDHVRLVDQS